MGTRTELEAGAGALADYYEWAHSARHGDVLVYWLGDLQYDRQVTVDHDDPDAARKKMHVMAANSLAKRIFEDQKSGNLILVQKRVKEGTWEYQAVAVRTAGDDNQKVFGPNDSLVLV